MHTISNHKKTPQHQDHIMNYELQYTEKFKQTHINPFMKEVDQ